MFQVRLRHPSTLPWSTALINYNGPKIWLHYPIRQSAKKCATRRSSPLRPALVLALQSPSEILSNPTWRGRVFEATIGAHLAKLPNTKLFYWRGGRDEVNFVIKSGPHVLGVEATRAARKSSGASLPRRATMSINIMSTCPSTASLPALLRIRCVTEIVRFV